MASFARDLWFITPLQALATIGTAANFGGSALQSPLIMPTLSLEKVPVQYNAIQIRYLVHESEKFFPPLNALCTLSNIVVGVTTFLYRDTSASASAKLPYAVAGTVLNLATTAWAILIMVPLNRSMAKDADALEANSTNENAAKSLRKTQQKWRQLNLVRASMMISASIVGLVGLLQDGALVKIPSK
ncbi:hypothetical protein AMS68_006722 [Peltaster fructicola]|uniref:DUF1772 domain-containing protein n=1 Tax=Peltaster fructicola TaxID=286661 RepID=A0A6H0Y2Q9_9PEZI|nr:hypothetical protein AMS68_006722 [Peltaster fructicola]